MIFLAFLFVLGGHAVELPVLTPQKLGHLTSAARFETLEVAGKILALVEREEIAQDTHAWRCVRAGWVFDAARCDLPILHQGCEPNEIRCAAWTGRAGCVKQTPAGRCLTEPTEAERQIRAEYFTARATAVSLNELWDVVRRKCRVDKLNKNCVQLKGLLAPKNLDGYLQGLWRLLSPLPQAAAAEAPCGLEPKNRFFTKPDGHRVYLLFGIHQEETEGAGDAPIDQELAKDQGDASAVKDFMQTRIDSGNNDEMIKQGSIIKTLTEQGKLNWVALETLPTNFGRSSLDQWRLSTDHYKKKLGQLGIPDAVSDAYFGYAWGPTLYGAIRHEPWQAKLELVPFDDDAVKIEQQRVLDEIRTTPSGDLSAPEGAKLRDFLKRKIDGGESLGEAEAGEYLKVAGPKGRAQLKIFIDKTRTFVQLRERRDRLALDRILARPGNGLLNIGEAHRDQILKGLAERCAKLSPSGEHTERPATTR